MCVGDLVDIYFVPISPMFGPCTPELMNSGIIVDLSEEPDDCAFYVTCLTHSGDTEVIEIGMKRPDFFFDVEVVSKCKN